ncbi:TetR/AcrR family transcriptional regulator [Rhodococcus erythropolis]|jgi:AcrR family transcriptional regulator|uniref:TetR family transcriptional regulator n=4 Tax=Rhodococcus erythropolis group TaxID=2840174 RepID=A0A0E3VCS9_RHOER|nr:MULTISPECIES: TetR/AcrR family transcriptional regulator [Rhodococcus]MCD2156463.1 TetR/AcrR family transcriptional regulator [Rhodococcus cerastii]NHE68088.1 TetR/AcrR family transcriptional regulator [Rhodococcus sp. D-46]NHP17708.1 TetR/AcrR family transcriptional regulator [Rhodococcus sp. IC4_135]OCC21021.1 TetR family transcriptional regulator [Prescottella equi]AGT93679.1 TetR family transcriptional regulator [Rhodococcus erythropolis CCM2595]
MDAVKRTRLDPAQRRAQLIDLGARMLAERPLEQISVEDIADQAGVSRGLLFHYFASKSEFHLAIVRHSSEQMLQRTEPSESDDPMLTLRSVLASYVDYVTENRNTYVSLLRGTASGDPQMREVFEQTRDIMAKRTLDQLPKIGLTRTPQVELAVRGWIAFVEEATISWLRAPAITREELIDLTVQSLPALALAAVGFDAGPDLGLLQSN